ncbi:MAG TPA: NAD(P)H-hydrate dehydratase [Solirubrobacteraceae bacterium]|nr:NAD(P)H-hydrate dehydratase [Solirubrobacteraceae bacterium]
MSLASWLEPLPDAARMRATDAWAIEERGVPSLELMERAGQGLAALAAELAGEGRIVVVAGKGNNAGDGLVAARLLRAAGRDVDVVSAGELSALQGDAAVNLERLPGDAPTPLGAGISANPALVIDALLGTGASGAPRAEIAAAIAAIAGCGAAVVLAADVPSGVDASSGEVAGDAVAADATATFHAAKPGLWIEPGRSHAGRVSVIEIGIPDGAPGQADVGLIRDSVLEVVPRRERGSTKFSSGRVLVAGGSAGLTGAPSLAALAAARAGAGYVTVCVPASLALVFEARLLEAMTLAVSDEDGAHSAAGVAAVAEAASARGGALVLGPGLGRSDGAREFAHGVLSAVEVPVVLDADGLNAFAGDAAALGGRAAVLTPHAGELGRLLGVESAQVERSRLRYAREAAALTGGVVVLKGDDTLIAAPDGVVAVSPGATPALATAGTGDVLSGVAAAMLAKGLEPFVAACAAVRLHALAGIAAAAARGSVEGVIASDVIEALAGVR